MVKNSTLFLLFLLPCISLLGQQYHRCDAGDKDYKPGHSLSIQNRGLGFDLRISIDAQDWYDPQLLGREATDWLKAAGVSYFSWFRAGTWPKNHLSALVGFRMQPNQQFQVCAYVNDLEGKHKADGIINANVGDTITVRYRLDGSVARYELAATKQRVVVSFDSFRSASKQLAVGPWHGGSSPAPVPTGVWTELIWINE